MKIIKEGRKQTGWSKELTCTGKGNGGGGCGAILLVEQTDLYNTFSTVRDETDVYVTFTCPSCGIQTDVEDFPRSIKLKSKEDYLKSIAESQEKVVLDPDEHI